MARRKTYKCERCGQIIGSPGAHFVGWSRGEKVYVCPFSEEDAGGAA